MRKLSFLLLLATAAAPAIAAGDDNRNSRHDRGASSDQSENRPQRAARSESRSQRASERASERRGPESREQRASAAQRPERGQASQQQAAGPVRQYIQEQRQQRVQAAAAAPGGDANAGTVRRTQRDSASGQAQTNWRERERRVRTVPDTTPQATQQGSRDRSAFRDRDRRDYRDGNYTRWSNNHWRGDRRYDWRRYRDRNRSVFRIGFYSDPFGWNYRRWSVGSFLNAGFYRSSYWLNDPWHYRLPPAYGPYRWVRYWNDALLVNIYTGQVEDVIHGFFW